MANYSQKIKLLILFLVFYLVLTFNLLNAQIHQDTTPKSQNIHGYNHHTHHIAVFNGFTSNLDTDHTDYTLGVDYEYRFPYLNKKFGLGLVGEVVFAEHQEKILAVSFYYHPFADFKFNVSAGYAFADDGHGESEKHFLTRIGAAYDFHVSGFSIGPVFNLDFLEGHTYPVFGISIGKGF